MLKGLPLILVLMLLLPACTEDKCKGVICQNDGVCVEGSCTCEYGYEGETCESMWYEKFAGSWNAVDTFRDDTTGQSYQLSIIGNETRDSFLITGFADTIDTVICERKSYYVFTISKKQIDSTHSIESGEATLNDATKKVTGMYSFKAGDTTMYVDFTWTR